MDEMPFSSEIYRNFHTARRQKTLPGAAGLQTRATFVASSYLIDALYQLSYTVMMDWRLEITNYILNVINILVYINPASNILVL